MGNGTKVALVALLILMVVVIARFVRDTSDEGDADLRAGAARSQDAGKSKAASSAPADASTTRTAGIGKQEKKAPVPAGNTGTASGNPGAGPGTGAVLGSGTPSAGGALVTSGPGTTSGPSPSGSSPSGTIPSGTTGGTPRGLNDPAARNPGTTLPPSGVAPFSGNQRGPLEPGGSVSKETPRAGTPSVGDLHPPAPRGTEGSATEVKSPLKPGLQSNPLGSGGSQTALVEGHRQERSDLFPPSPGQKGASAPSTAGEGTKLGMLPGHEEGKKVADDAKGSGAGQAAGSSYPKTHLIEKGDSYWTLAERYYKKGSLWPQIEKANPGVKVLPGKTLTIPEPLFPVKRVPATRSGSNLATEPGTTTHHDPGQGETKKATPAAPRKSTQEGTEHGTTATREYRVQKGDTLSSLARKFYRDARKSHLIEEANTHLRYQTLQEGATITIPAEK